MDGHKPVRNFRRIRTLWHERLKLDKRGALLAFQVLAWEEDLIEVGSIKPIRLRLVARTGLPPSL